MPDLTLKERIRIAALAAGRSQRSVLAQMLESRLLRWSITAPPAADQILIVPQDLRTADPSFWHEIEQGQFGLAGTLAFLNERSPFDIAPPNEAWARELHGFGWLRNLAVAPEEEAHQTARRLAAEWAIRSGAQKGIAAEPAVAARRLISWMSHALLLLEGADAATYEIITTSLGRQLASLAAARRDVPDGYPRLLVLIALMLAELSIAGHGRQLKNVEAAFAAELDRQILPDGGHISRNPAVLVEIMLDLLPLSQCFTARSRQHPQPLLEVMARVLPILRFLRLGDGMLARFNGVSIPAAAGLATVLAYCDTTAPDLGEARASGYARLECGGSVVVADVGTPPPLIVAGEAQAGCLSFEMSVGEQLMFVNGGMPGPAGADWQPAARATASHNTLCLAETSSSTLLTRYPWEPIRHPDRVDWHMDETEDGLVLEAEHDGYHRRFGLLHSRRLALAADGARLVGADRLDSPRHNVRLRTDLPFAIHFHLHPDVSARIATGPDTAVIELPDGELWRFSAQGAALTIEEGAYFANSAGPCPALQIVLRAATFGESEVSWVAERITTNEEA